jgi:hypothetical protein
MIRVQTLTDILENPPLTSRAFFPEVLPELIRARDRAQIYGLPDTPEPKGPAKLPQTLAHTPLLLGQLIAATHKPNLKPEDLLVPLRAINQAIEHSPQPTQDWAYATTLFEAEFLSRVLGISPASLRRYQEGGRSTPDAVAERLHWLVLRAIDLSGSYSPPGVRRWFLRKREKLGGAAPIDFLKHNWGIDDPKIKAISELARSLTEL